MTWSSPWPVIRVEIPGLILVRVFEEMKTTAQGTNLVEPFVFAWLGFRVSFGGSP